MSYLVLTSGQKLKKPFEPFLRKISRCLILGYFGDLFANISKSRIFFKNPTLSLSYLYSPLTSSKKSEKSFEPFLRKLRYQSTNQPSNQLLPTTPILQVLTDADPKSLRSSIFSSNKIDEERQKLKEVKEQKEELKYKSLT